MANFVISFWVISNCFFKFTSMVHIAFRKRFLKILLFLYRPKVSWARPRLISRRQVHWGHASNSCSTYELDIYTTWPTQMYNIYRGGDRFWTHNTTGHNPMVRCMIIGEVLRVKFLGHHHPQWMVSKEVSCQKNNKLSENCIREARIGQRRLYYEIPHITIWKIFLQMSFYF